MIKSHFFFSKQISEYLTELNLSHNNFMENGAVMISKGLGKRFQ